MKPSKLKLTLVYAFAILSMTFAVWQMRETPVKAFHICCSVGQDCPSSYPECKLPTSGTADCSTDKKNYCKSDDPEIPD